MARIKPVSAVFAAHAIMLTCHFGFAGYSGFLFQLRWGLIELLVPMHAAILGLLVLVLFHQKLFDDRFVRRRGSAWIAGLNALASVVVVIFGITTSSGPTFWNAAPRNQIIEGITVMSLIALAAAYFFTLFIQGMYHRGNGTSRPRRDL